MERCKRAIRTLAPVIVLLALPTCGFTPGHLPGELCTALNQAPLAPIASTGVTKVFEDSGIIAVYHGFACAESNKSGQEDILKVHESMNLPGFASAAVFLNGWNLRYLNGKHNV